MAYKSFLFSLRVFQWSILAFLQAVATYHTASRLVRPHGRATATAVESLPRFSRGAATKLPKQLVPNPRRAERGCQECQPHEHQGPSSCHDRGAGRAKQEPPCIGCRVAAPLSPAASSRRAQAQAKD